MSLSARIVNRLLEDGASEERIQFIAQQLGLPVDQVRELDQYDPTNGKYLSWIAKMAKSEVLRFPEDGEKTRSTLETFRSLSRKPNFRGERDLNKYRSYGAVVQSNEENGEVKTKGETVRASEQKGVRLLKEMGGDKLYEVTSPEAAAKLFRHTEWCVRDPKWFNQYNPSRFYYVDRNGSPFALLHPESSQMKNVSDEDLKDEVAILEDVILTCPYLAAEYADNVFGGRWPEAEMAIRADAAASLYYAKHVIGAPWPEGEAAIARDVETSMHYAVDVVGDRWPPGEPSISKDAFLAYMYARDAVKGRWPEAEDTIRKNPELAYEYASDVIKGRWPEAEDTIRKNPQWAYEYALYVIKGRWPEAEDTIRKYPQWVYKYARDVIKGRWPEAEDTIRKDHQWVYKYARDVVKGRWPEAEAAMPKD